ncbi:MAG: ATP synthase F1 subunit delta [Deltaproteobacteria bacterium]|nr:ATP synthase F1 subunit delta [Deltaproteobacteria bacterium]
MKKPAAKRYAKALIEISQEEKQYKEIGVELRNIAAAFAANPELKRLLLNPMYKLEDRQAFIEKVAAALEVSPSVKKFLSILVTTRGIAAVEDISASYTGMEDALAGRMNVTVESPVDLSEARITEMKKRLQDAMKKEITLSVEKNPALIAGLVFRIGNTILDGSVRTQLQKVRERIVSAHSS